MPMHVRIAVEGDARAIAVAHTRAWQVAYEDLMPADFLAAIDVDSREAGWRSNLTEAALPDGTPSPTNFVAEMQGEVVGFACVGVDREHPADASRIELWAIYVHPEQWGTGAGHALMEQTMRHARDVEAEQASLWVLDGNERACRFYERQGWRATDESKTEEIGGSEVVERKYVIDV